MVESTTTHHHDHGHGDTHPFVDICSIEDDAERNAVWQMMYFEKWGTFPNNASQNLMNEFMKSPDFHKAAELVYNEAAKLDERLKNLTYEDF